MLRQNFNTGSIFWYLGNKGNKNVKNVFSDINMKFAISIK